MFTKRPSPSRRIPAKHRFCGDQSAVTHPPQHQQLEPNSGPPNVSRSRSPPDQQEEVSRNVSTSSNVTHHNNRTTTSSSQNSIGVAARLPPGWSPIRADYDDISHHRLWNAQENRRHPSPPPFGETRTTSATPSSGTVDPSFGLLGIVDDYSPNSLCDTIGMKSSNSHNNQRPPSAPIVLTQRPTSAPMTQLLQHSQKSGRGTTGTSPAGSLGDMMLQPHTTTQQRLLSACSKRPLNYFSKHLPPSTSLRSSSSVGGDVETSSSLNGVSPTPQRTSSSAAMSLVHFKQQSISGLTATEDGRSTSPQSTILTSLTRPTSAALVRGCSTSNICISTLSPEDTTEMTRNDQREESPAEDDDELLVYSFEIRSPKKADRTSEKQQLQQETSPTGLSRRASMAVGSLERHMSMASGGGSPLSVDRRASRAPMRESRRLKLKQQSLELASLNRIPTIFVEFFDVRGPEYASASMPQSISKPRKKTKRSMRSIIGRRTSVMETFRFLTANAGRVNELYTCIPMQDLHLYQMYCANMDMIIIFRPISPHAAPMYATTFLVPPEFCDEQGIPLSINDIDAKLDINSVFSFTTSENRVRGKGISVSLKSSPYSPIAGLIPVNPNLSKIASEALKKERDMEDQFISADSFQSALYRRLKSHRHILAATQYSALKEIEASIEDSNRKLDAVLKQYETESMYSQNKLAVSEKFICALNDAQYLSKSIAKWRGFDLYYRPTDDGLDVERLSSKNPIPIFYAKRSGCIHRYNHGTNELDKDPLTALVSAGLEPVFIVTHKSFVICPITHRIIPDPRGDFLIAPDFDGFAYASHAPTTLKEYLIQCDKRMELRPVASMGLVSPLDEQHVIDMRLLTDWKQNHGYECCNTIKTQDISEGVKVPSSAGEEPIPLNHHVAILPTGVRLLQDFASIMLLYREAWSSRYPLLLNPNWRVVVSPDHASPIPLTFSNEDINTPVVDDCGLTTFKEAISHQHLALNDLKVEAMSYLTELRVLRKTPGKHRLTPLYSSSFIPRLACILAKKELAEKFFAYRRWILMPPFYTGAKTGFESLAARVPDAAFEHARREKLLPLESSFHEAYASFESCFSNSAEDERFVQRLKFYTDPHVAAKAVIDLEARELENMVEKEFLETTPTNTPRGSKGTAATFGS